MHNNFPIIGHLFMFKLQSIKQHRHVTLSLETSLLVVPGVLGLVRGLRLEAFEYVQDLRLETLCRPEHVLDLRTEIEALNGLKHWHEVSIN